MIDARARRLGVLTRWSLVGLGPMWLVLAANDLGFNIRPVAASAAIGCVLVLVLLRHTRLTVRALSGAGPGAVLPWVDGPLLVVTLLLWANFAERPLTGIDWAMVPAAHAAALAVALPPPARWRLLAATASVGGVAGEALTRWRASDPLALPGVPALTGVSLVLFISGVELMLVRLWQALEEAERARAGAAALAVAEERLRFAADLHDIQGHRLQVIALKSELAERMIGRDDSSAREQVAEAARLAREAMAEAQAVVRGYRRASLGTELANAVQVLRAAGIRTEVEGDAARVPSQLQPLFGTLVREGTTNVLRHSAASRCLITISADGARTRVRLSNNGTAAPAEGSGGSGLAALRERFGSVGGRVSATRLPDGTFELTGLVGAGCEGGEP
ncbi:sensor histidine kinase [Streptomyces sp. NPDC050504]|uniref:sensor histidine kinase n=1 Tax=Streptomyces sp. NPDC050504 TaxID=3365618 RepID=UPI0037AEA618